ncbi:Glycosyl hydrolases family 43 [Amycolatopsis marina]|uniref:Glycosyl hydrolases family 43 n=1 Tax=Amycolatopsis marina TaxID=490629 RepID=A0A1I0ZBR3_9PSEU|nr:family 43 glycosylhydrolase [Amycolatopsis marina]SFB22010.1 Glycosyl hydrolases family 43 [Amycolatopsis marina]
MRSARRRTRPVAAALVALASAALAACSPSTAQPQAGGAEPGAARGIEAPADVPEPQPLAVDSVRQSAGTVAAGGADAVYNYGPTVMADGDRTRMWWCSQYGSAKPAGDDILYAEATWTPGAKKDLKFTGPGGGAAPAVFSGRPGGFDGVHTCDPSVLRVGGTYYLYYTGSAGDRAHGNSIGLATSKDGRNWKRVGSGPILTPAHDVARDNDYGAGQPAVVHLDGWFYLMFTDTSGAAAGWNGAGQFLLRSADPAFAGRVEALGPDGFEPVADTSAPRRASVVDAFSADLMFVDALDAFAIAHETEHGTTLTFWNREFTANPYHQVLVAGPWKEGPGLFRRPDGHAPMSLREPCSRVPLDVVRATVIGAAKAPTGLRHFGADLHKVDGCGEQGRTLGVLDGLAMPSPVRTMDLVTGGRIVRVDRRSVATELARTVLDQRVPAIEGIPVAARLAPAARILRAKGHGLGLLLDDGGLWPVVGSAASRIPDLNGSAVEQVSEREWERYPAGVVLGS